MLTVIQITLLYGVERKIATAYAVLKTFGPDYRFRHVGTDGQMNTSARSTAIFTFRARTGFSKNTPLPSPMINRLGIRSITGDLIVTDNFAMNLNTSAQRASSTLLTAMDSAKRPVAATRAWQNYLINSGKYAQVIGVPSVAITGGVYVQAIPTNAKLLFSHESTPMREIIKTTLCYSNNFLSERLGDMLGGSYAVAKIVQQNTQIQPQEFVLQSSSGLGVNRVTPHAMMSLLRVLRKELARNKMLLRILCRSRGLTKERSKSF